MSCYLYFSVQILCISAIGFISRLIVMKYSPFLRDHSMENSDLRVSISNTVAWSALISTFSLIADAEPKKSGLKNQIIKVSCNNRHLKIYLLLVFCVNFYVLLAANLSHPPILPSCNDLPLLPSRIFIARKYRNQKLMKKWHAPSCLAFNLSLKKSSEIL